ncbi:hypothetical protein BHE74_00059243, partial [Ensete ventricosum]
VSSGKAPSTRATAPAREVGVSPAREVPKTSSKRSIDAPTEQADDPARRQGDGFSKFPTFMALFDRVHDAGRLITFIDYWISQLQQELDALKSGGGPEAVAKVEERASELEQELEKTKRERDEAL